MTRKTKAQLERELAEAKRLVKEASRSAFVFPDIKIDSRGQWHTPDPTNNTPLSMTVLFFL